MTLWLGSFVVSFFVPHTRVFGVSAKISTSNMTRNIIHKTHRLDIRVLLLLVFGWKVVCCVHLCCRNTALVSDDTRGRTIILSWNPKGKLWKHTDSVSRLQNIRLKSKYSQRHHNSDTKIEPQNTEGSKKSACNTFRNTYPGSLTFPAKRELLHLSQSDNTDIRTRVFWCKHFNS